MIETLGAFLQNLFTVIGMAATLFVIGRALLMRSRRSVTMAGRKG